MAGRWVSSEPDLGSSGCESALRVVGRAPALSPAAWCVSILVPAEHRGPFRAASGLGSLRCLGHTGTKISSDCSGIPGSWSSTLPNPPCGQGNNASPVALRPETQISLVSGVTAAQRSAGKGWENDSKTESQEAAQGLQ